MREEVQLYLAGQEVEFNEPPKILFSYIRSEYSDPTILRNSYSKTLTIEGTPNNNQIFSSIYHLDKISDYGTFNPAKRMEFKLFSNGDILEQGYAKLDRINKKENRITYDVTLYGGLGEFLYNLSYDQTAEGSDTSRGGGEERRLSSLIYYDNEQPNQEFDFDITKDTVAEAWEALEKGTGKTMWQYINFAPAYNGYPEDFDADKVLINTQNSSVPVTFNNNGMPGSSVGFPTSITEGDDDEQLTYRTYNNYALGELPKEMTEWEMRDLRSYLQRPVLSMKGFLNAIANPANNGGYEVDFDQTFFNSDNPYYENAWFTLPQLKKDEVETGRSAKTVADNNVLTVGSSMGEDYDRRYYLEGLRPGAVYQGIDLTFSFNTVISGMPDEVYTTVYDYNIGPLLHNAAYYSSIFVQLVGEDSDGNPIAASPIYNFTSPYGNEKTWWFIGLGTALDPTKFKTRKSFNYTPALEAEDINMLGRFVRTTGNNYVWQNADGNLSAFTASLSDKYEYDRVYFRVTKCYQWRTYTKDGEPNLNCYEEQIFSGLTNTEEKRRNILGGYVQRDLNICLADEISDITINTSTFSAKTAVTTTQIVGSQVKYSIASDVVRSGDHISKGDLLNFDGTPCDYLLSYCKLFNLYISKDQYDKKIYIRTRDTFYNGGTVDLEQFIDRSKDIKVNPLAMDSRWYDFAYPEDEKCGAAEDYDFNYGVQYGKNKVQTTYEFDSEAKDLFEDNIFRNGVQVQESSKYFTIRTADEKTVPTYLYNQFDYILFRSPNDTLGDCKIRSSSNYTQTGYTSESGREDWLPKLQFNNGNETIDGQNVLCFFGGFKTSPYVGGQQAIYYLTDDLAEMYVVNGETPCWVWSLTEYNGSDRIAIGMTKLPVFSRMLYDDTEDKIQYTWDFGRVRNTYVPVKNYVDNSTIFERWWADYIADLYNADTRVVECYVKMEGKVVGDWLRKMYWWDNCYWVLTEINDYNITSYDTTKCKFIKVNDIANYTDGIIIPTAATPYAIIYPARFIVPGTGATIPATIVTSDGGAWTLTYSSGVTPSVTAGTGNTNITLEFSGNPNLDGRPVTLTVTRVRSSSVTIWQNAVVMGEKSLSVTDDGFILGPSSGYVETTVYYRNRGNDDVVIDTGVDWITTTGASWNGDVGTVRFVMSGSNDTEEVKSTVITFVSSSDTALTDTITIDRLPNALYFNGNGESKSLTLLNSVTQVVAMSGYFVNYETTEHTITFTAPVNTAEQQRQEVDYIYTDVGSGRVNLIQAGGGGMLQVSPTAISVDYNSTQMFISISSTHPWSATSIPNWIIITPSTGTGMNMIGIQIDMNYSSSARTGTLEFSDGTRIASVEITQGGNTVQNYLNVSPQSLNYDWNGGVKYINISSSLEWEVPSKPSWISVDALSGYSGTSILTLSAQTNNATIGRTGTVTIMNGANTVTIPVAQSQRTTQRQISVSPDQVYYDPTGSTSYVTVLSEENPWYLVSKPEWIVLSQNSGRTGFTMLMITASEYTGTTTRSGTITLTDGNSTVGINVSQSAPAAIKSLTASPSILYVDGTGGTVEVSIIYNNRGGDDVIITSSETWVTPGFVSWSGDSGQCIVTVDSYALSQLRNADITITAVEDSGLTASVAVRQPANETRLIVGYNVTSTTEPTNITYSYSGFSGAEYPDGTPITLGTGYTFPSTGMQYVYYTLTGTSIPSSAFWSTDAVTVYIPDQVTSIGNLSFSETLLDTLTLPSGLTSIGTGAFDTTPLQDVTIPASVTGINQTAFAYSDVSTFRFSSSTPPTLGTSALTSENLQRIIVPCAYLNAYMSAFTAYTQYITCESDDTLYYITDTSIIPGSGETRTITLLNADLDPSKTRLQVNDAYYSVDGNVITITYLENQGPLQRTFMVQIFAETNDGDSLSSLYYIDQEPYVEVIIPYTADTSMVDASGETRTITLDTTGLILSSITVSTNDTAVTATYSAGTVTLVFPENYDGQRDVTVLIEADTSQGYYAYTSIDYVQGVKPYRDYLTFSITSGGYIYWKATNASVAKTIEYSKDNGATWTSITASTSGTRITTSAGDVIKFRGNNQQYAAYTTSVTEYNTFGGSTGRFEIYGNIMSLVSSTGYVTTTTLTGDHNFYGLFNNCSGLTSAEKLVMPVGLTDGCFGRMFLDCLRMTTAPVLSATTLTPYCYYYMFGGCTGLTGSLSYIMPSASTVAESCCEMMFTSCNKMTAAPALPATTVAKNCYNNMFNGCTGLTTSPALSARTLVEGCYRQMFYGCRSLNSIKCLATDITATDCTTNWVNNVASSGIFTKRTTMESWTTGTSGIPTNWTVQNAVR